MKTGGNVKALGDLKLNRKAIKILAIAFACIAALTILAIVFHAPILQFCAQAWIVDQSTVDKVDVVVIPGGGVETRPFKAAEWYHVGKCARLVTFKVQPTPAVELGVMSPEEEITLEVLKDLKVPRNAVQVIGDGVTSTQEEVQAMKKWADRAKPDSIAVMTEIFPSRRVLWAYHNAFKGSKTKIVVVAISPPGYTGNDWWLNENGLISFQNEVIKYFYYRLRY